MATRTISNAGGNWDSTGSWVEGVVPIAGDAVVATGTSGNLTVNVASACTSIILTNYVATLTFDSTLTTTGTVTFVAGMTIAGTAGTLILNTGGYTITSGGKTLTCGLTFGTNSVYTLADNWVVSGSLSIPNSATINGAGKTLTCNSGLSVTGASSVIGGTAKFIIGGGTWSSASTGAIGIDVDLAGNVTVSGAIAWGATGKTLRYVSGTITTTGSTLTVTTATTLDTAGVTWNNFTFNSLNTYTLASDLAWSGILTNGNSFGLTGAGKLNGTGSVNLISATVLTMTNTGGIVTTGTMTYPNGAITFAGSSGWTVGTLASVAYNGTRIVTLAAGVTYAVTTSLSNNATSAFRQTLKSGTPGTKAIFTVTPGAGIALSYCDPTDINSSGGSLILSVGGTITNSDNWSGAYTAPTGGTGMTIARTNGAFTGTSETVGDTIAAGATATGSEVDLLADATSQGNIDVYLVFTTHATDLAQRGSIDVSIQQGRLTGQMFVDPVKGRSFPVAGLVAGTAYRAFVGRYPASRFMRGVVRNSSDVALTNVSLLYTLEKQT